MTSDEIIYLLKNDFEFLATVIVFNNPVAVQDRIVETYPKQFENEEAMLQVIFEFANRGDEEFVDNALSVPFLTENANAELNLAWEQIKIEAGTGAKFSDWSGGMFQAIGMIGSSIFAGGGAGGGGTFPMGYPPQPEPRRDYTIWYVLGGLAFIIIIAIFLMSRGRS